ncbi:S-adenosyl-L-methionine-dependent methyltransferase [Fusarium flagelliforme]|uniref:S-adenosyl-L-methionine-dependent methyltransferase n=1 Tax=Fusarium flagelliforme TaxID=2675880 RepID=UPI001E8CAFC5|nr:S-adenosyl-L-methionine-dependent methyltransferase [Fusarium flagelliforme]KAH7185205.1 S-adenosyl-L-methionine-dependent methyltransferase [Fusarium flagelliforme]
MSIVQPIFRDEPFLPDDDDWNTVQHIEWELDANFFTGCTSRPRTPLNKAVADHEITLARAAALVIRISLNNIPVDVPDFDPASLKGYRKQLFQWMNTYIASPASKLLLGDVTMSVTIEILSSLPKMGVEGEILAKIGPNLGGILQETVDPIPLLATDNRIYRMQDDMELIQKMREHLGDYLSCFATKEDPINVLEIGASTSHSTKTIINAFSGQKNVSYTITDRSLSILNQIKSSQTGTVNLKALDINQDPLDQGFSPESFNVVLVNNILYTANSLSKVLGDTRKLLAPGGILLLVGLSNMSPAYNLIFGMNENMWSDVSYEQSEYPSVSEWNAVLQSNGFSMLEPATKTFDHIGQSSYCVVATAISTTRNLMVNIIPDKEGKLFSFAHQLSTTLIGTNTASTISPNLSDDISSRFIYTVLDDGSSSLEEYQDLVEAKNVLWISMSTGSVQPRDMDMLKRFARSARGANEELKLVTLEIKQDFPEYAELLKVVRRIIQLSFQEDRGPRMELEYEYVNGKVLVPRVKNMGGISKTM